MACHFVADLRTFWLSFYRPRLYGSVSERTNISYGILSKILSQPSADKKFVQSVMFTQSTFWSTLRTLYKCGNRNINTLGPILFWRNHENAKLPIPFDGKLITKKEMFSLKNILHWIWFSKESISEPSTMWNFKLT